MSIYISEDMDLSKGVIVTDTHHLIGKKRTRRQPEEVNKENSETLSQIIQDSFDTCPIAVGSKITMTKQGFKSMCKKVRATLSHNETAKRKTQVVDLFSSRKTCKKCKIKKDVDTNRLGDLEWVTWLDI